MSEKTLKSYLMPEEKNVDNTGTSSSDSATGNDTGDSNSDASVMTEKHSEEESKRTVPYERFAEKNREAKLAHELKKKLGLVSEEDFEDWVKTYSPGQSSDSSVDPVAKELAEIKSSLARHNEYFSRQQEESEWSKTVSKDPDLESFKDTIQDLGRQDKYRKMSYVDIFKKVVKPAVEYGYRKAQGKETEKAGAQVQTRSDKQVAPQIGDVDINKFKQMSVKEKEAYLKSKGLA